MKGKVMLDACYSVSTRDGTIADEVEQNGIRSDDAEVFPGCAHRPPIQARNVLHMVFAREVRPT